MNLYIENMKCILCKAENIDKRIVEIEGDTLTVITLCKQCFTKRIKPMIDENADNIQEIIQWFKDRRLILHKENLIDSIDPHFISNLDAGIYRIKITVLDDLFDNFTNSPEDYLIDKTNIGLNNRINRAFLNQSNNKKYYIEDSEKKEQGVNLKEMISDTKINPNLIIRQEILANSKCPKCNINLDFFLRQITVGCSYCFVNFFDYIKEYAESINNNIEKEELKKENNSKIKQLQLLKEEAVKNKNWDLAIKYRDEIKIVQKGLKGKTNE